MEKFSSRLQKALDYRGKRPVDLVEETGISKGMISRYLNGKVQAKQNNIYIISKALNIKPLYLMGISDQMILSFDVNNIPKETDDSKNKINELVDLAYSLDSESLVQLIELAKLLKVRRSK